MGVGGRASGCAASVAGVTKGMSTAKATKHLDVPSNSGLVALLRVKLR